jgi:hypothetical protein
MVHFQVVEQPLRPQGREHAFKRAALGFARLYADEIAKGMH